MRIAVRVYPRSTRTVVGGRFGSEEPPVLIVRVSEPAAAGRANEACTAALAAALRVPQRNIRIVAGSSSRSKVIDIDGGDPTRLAALLQR